MTVFPELSEHAATGKIAEIYAEIRAYCAVPYVSSLQRQLATVPGCLEWAWAAMRPAVTNGEIPEAAWRQVESMSLPVLPPLTRPKLRTFAVDAASESTIHAIYETFYRASPVNMIVGGLIRRFLTSSNAERLSAVDRPVSRPWSPPPPLPDLPNFVADGNLSPDTRATLAQFETTIDGSVFIPGLYRLLAHWPAYLGYVADHLGSARRETSVLAVCREVEDRMATQISTIAAGLRPALPPFDGATARRIVASIDVYRRTSPEMIVFSAMLRGALPPPE